MHQIMFRNYICKILIVCSKVTLLRIPRYVAGNFIMLFSQWTYRISLFFELLRTFSSWSLVASRAVLNSFTKPAAERTVPKYSSFNKSWLSFTSLWSCNRRMCCQLKVGSCHNCMYVHTSIRTLITQNVLCFSSDQSGHELYF